MKYLEKTGFCAIGRHSIVVFESALIVLIWTVIAQGQLGMGDSRGVAQQSLKPRLVRISGKLQEIKTHPCDNTTGKAELGTHLILKDKHGRELNVHLGPASELSETVKRITVGANLNLLGFHTNKMHPNHYVAKTLLLPVPVSCARSTVPRRPKRSGSRILKSQMSRDRKFSCNSPMSILNCVWAAGFAKTSAP